MAGWSSTRQMRRTGKRTHSLGVGVAVLLGGWALTACGNPIDVAQQVKGAADSAVASAERAEVDRNSSEYRAAKALFDSNLTTLTDGELAQMCSDVRSRGAQYWADIAAESAQSAGSPVLTAVQLAAFQDSVVQACS